MFNTKKLATGVVIALAASSAGVVASATYGHVTTSGSGKGAAEMSCPGGMTRLGHAFDENTSVFPGDPAIHVEIEYTVADDYFLVEDIDTGAHAGTHIDVPAHFIDDGRTLDDLSAREFVWPAYKIDVRDMILTDNQLSVKDIEDYEKEHGKIKKGSLVIIQTGAEEFFGLDGSDAYAVDPDDNADNTDDLFGFDNAGFSGQAVQWLFDEREIDGVGSDAYGPDAANDELFDATFTALDNDGIALVALANVDSLSVRSDIIVASAVNLTDGSGASVDPLACHGKPKNK